MSPYTEAISLFPVIKITGNNKTEGRARFIGSRIYLIVEHTDENECGLSY